MNATDPSGNVICGGVCLGIAAVALLSATGWLGTEIALAPDSGEAFDAGLGGVGAGAVNIADVFTWNQIDTLHTYRNRRFDELGITGTWTDTIATGGATAARESLIGLATLGFGQAARGTVGAVHYAARTGAVVGAGYEFGASLIQVVQGSLSIGHGIYTKNWREVAFGGLQVGLGGVGFYTGGCALRETLSSAPNSAAARSLNVQQWDNQRLFYNGTRQARAQGIVEEAAQAAGVRLGDYVDDVVFTTGRSPWFSIVNGRRTIALPANTLRKTEAGQLITAVHELSHARHSARLGHANYMRLYGTQRARIEVLVESRALRTGERYLGGLTPQQIADSMRYINSWLP